MKEIRGDLFECIRAEAICVTTNGYVNPRTGRNVMGKGTAGRAKELWPGIDLILGHKIQEEGHRAHCLTYTQSKLPPVTVLSHRICKSWIEREAATSYEVPYHIVAFPVKPEVATDAEQLIRRFQGQYAGHLEDLNLPGWMAKADLDLIQRSCLELVELTEQHGWDSVVLPRVGAGAGELSWEKQVRPLLANLLDGRFYAITPRD